jgi:hypothetical protein
VRIGPELAAQAPGRRALRIYRFIFFSVSAVCLCAGYAAATRLTWEAVVFGILGVQSLAAGIAWELVRRSLLPFAVAPTPESIREAELLPRQLEPLPGGAWGWTLPFLALVPWSVAIFDRAHSPFPMSAAAQIVLTIWFWSVCGSLFIQSHLILRSRLSASSLDQRTPDLGLRRRAILKRLALADGVAAIPLGATLELPTWAKTVVMVLPLAVALVWLLFSAMIYFKPIGPPTDRRWWFKAYYFDPVDAAALVPGPKGVGYKLNYGRPIAWLLAAPFALALATMLFSMMWSILRG